jgi:ABC-type multidrug transport system fused ATPase/permease subunit
MIHHDKDLRSNLYALSKSHWYVIATTMLLSSATQLSWIISSYRFSKVIDGKPGSIVSKIWIPVLFFFVGYIFESFSDLLDNYYMPKIEAYAQDVITGQILHTYKRNCTALSIGDIVAKINQLPYVLSELFWQYRKFIQPTFLVALFSSIFFFTVDRHIGMAYAACTFIFLGVVVYCVQKSVEPMMMAASSRDAISEYISDTLNNIPSIYAYNMAASELRRLRLEQEHMTNNIVKAHKSITTVRFVYNIFYLVIFTVVCGIAYALIKQNRLSMGIITTIGFVVSYVVCIYHQFSSNIGNFINNLGTLKTTQRYTTELMQYAHENPDGTKTIAPSSGKVVLQNVFIRYHDSDVVRGVSFVADMNEKILLRGQNGSGKSTILKALFGALPYAQGSITIGGVDVKNTLATVLRNAIIYVPQTPLLFDRTVYENVSYGNNATRDEVQALLKRFEITFATLDMPAGTKGSNFSGGQQQILYLLRAFLNQHAKLVLMDEPTAALDPKTKDKAMFIMQLIMQNRTAIFVSHDMDLMTLATKTIELADGKIVA